MWERGTCIEVKMPDKNRSAALITAAVTGQITVEEMAAQVGIWVDGVDKVDGVDLVDKVDVVDLVDKENKERAL